MKHWRQEIDPKNSNHCRACGLYLNQLPLSDNSKKEADVFWIGLSAVQLDDDDKLRIPLSPNTRSGKLIKTIEDNCNSRVSFYKTNLVKCLPLNENKIRYPQKLEMNKCFPNLINELNILSPRVVFLLGKQVSDFVLRKFEITSKKLSNNFQYESFTIDETLFIPIHHPSYILVYKRKYVNDYIEGISRIIEKANPDKVVLEVG